MAGKEAEKAVEKLRNRLKSGNADIAAQISEADQKAQKGEVTWESMRRWAVGSAENAITLAHHISGLKEAGQNLMAELWLHIRQFAGAPYAAELEKNDKSAVLVFEKLLSSATAGDLLEGKFADVLKKLANNAEWWPLFNAAKRLAKAAGEWRQELREKVDELVENAVKKLSSAQQDELARRLAAMKSGKKENGPADLVLDFAKRGETRLAADTVVDLVREKKLTDAEKCLELLVENKDSLGVTRVQGMLDFVSKKTYDINYFFAETR